MKYTVILGVDSYEFEDGATAIMFAELATKYFKPTEYCKELKPLISIEKEIDKAVIE